MKDQEDPTDSSTLLNKTKESYDLFVKTLNELSAAYEIQEDPNSNSDKITFRKITLNVYYHQLYPKISGVSMSVMFSRITGAFPDLTPSIIDNQKWNAEIDKDDIVWNRDSIRLSPKELAETCLVRLIEVDSETQ